MSELTGADKNANRWIAFGRDNESRRQAWLKKHLSRVPNGSKILDAGAGELRNSVYCKHLEYTSQDFCEYEGEGDGAALQMGNWDTSNIDLVSDITNIPADDGSFDIVLCTEVLEHVPDSAKAVQELSRLVRPGGQLIITAPFASLSHFAPYHYVSGLSRYWYEHHLTELGFEEITTQANGGWFDFLAQEIWRLPWVGKSYSKRVLGWLALLLGSPLLLCLRFMKSLDRGSHELLTFGWFVVARKR